MTTTTTEKTTLISGMSTRKGRSLAKKLAPYLASCENGAATIEIEIACSLIAKHAREITRLAIEDCNRHLTESERADDEAHHARLVALVAMLGRDKQGNELILMQDGDPRGNVVTIKIPSEAPHGGDTWGRDGEFSLID